MKYCVLKVFITSQLVGQLGICRINYRNFIRLQNQAKDDISRFAHSFINDPKFTHLLGRARKYIVENVQGGIPAGNTDWRGTSYPSSRELSSLKIFVKFLKSLLMELDCFYMCMFTNIGRREK